MIISVCSSRGGCDQSKEATSKEIHTELECNTYNKLKYITWWGLQQTVPRVHYRPIRARRRRERIIKSQDSSQELQFPSNVWALHLLQETRRWGEEHPEEVQLEVTELQQKWGAATTTEVWVWGSGSGRKSWTDSAPEKTAIESFKNSNCCKV